jgi:hypothetical protein
MMVWVAGVICAILLGVKFGAKVGTLALLTFVAIVAWRRAHAHPRGVAQFVRDDRGQPLRWTYESKLFTLNIDYVTLQVRIQAPEAKVDPDAAYPSSFKKYIEGPLDMTVPATCLDFVAVPETGVKTRRWSTPTVEYRAQGPVTVLVPGSSNTSYRTGRTRLCFTTYHPLRNVSMNLKHLVES